MPWTPEQQHRAQQRNASYHRFWTQRLAELASDTDHARRTAQQRCRWCWYVNRHAIAGQGFTRYTCQHCAYESMHETTQVPILCRPCAVTLAVCQQCGAPME